MRHLIESMDAIEKGPSQAPATTPTPKQVYEWVKTGHWSLQQFTSWLSPKTKMPRNASPEVQQLMRQGR